MQAPRIPTPSKTARSSGMGHTDNTPRTTAYLRREKVRNKEGEGSLKKE